ncbi:MAG: guanylate kinase [Anaerolineae bacterium]
MEPLLGSEPSDDAREAALLASFIHPCPVLSVISGPSGVGKDSVIKQLRRDSDVKFVVTVTSRDRRPGEVEGEDYYFVSQNEFERMIEAGEMLEHALVYHQYKGIERIRIRQALSAGVDVIMRLDVQGAATVKRLIPQCQTIFIAPPSRAILLHRLAERGSDSPAQVQQRMVTALVELERAQEFDYVVVNQQDRLDETVRTVQAIILAAKCRTGRQPIVV